MIAQHNVLHNVKTAVLTTILRKLTQILSWCAFAAVKNFSRILDETDYQCILFLSIEVKNLNKDEIGALDICKQLNTIGSLTLVH